MFAKMEAQRLPSEPDPLSQCQALQLLRLRFDKELNPPRHPQGLLLWLPLSQLWQSLP
jgi:hypothetical protein